MEPPRKRQRTQFSVAEKREIANFWKANPKCPQANIASHFSKLWGKTVGRSTVGDIIRDSAKWTNASKDGENAVRSRSGKFVQLEEALFLWFSDVRSQNGFVNDMMLVEKAKHFGAELQVDESFRYSVGWLLKFKKRHNISIHTAHGEAASADLMNVAEGRQQLQTELEDIDPEDIYNLDETGLFYRLPPNSTLATGPVRGQKRQKDRLTVALCANATGTDKRKPLVIGKAARPRCFTGAFDPRVYVEYTSNQRAWMTTSVFHDWLQAFDREMRLERRRVLLLLDNATSHGITGLRLTNVTVKFLPPNTTSHIQPMDAGIIRNFKGFYKQRLVRHFLECIEERKPQTVNVKQAITFLKEAWDRVKDTTIVNCWAHTKILPTSDEDDIPLSELRAASEEDDMPLAELQTLLQRMPDDNRMEASDYMAIDETIETGEALTDNAILELVGNTQERQNDEEEDDETDVAEEIVPRVEAKQGLATAIRHFEQNPSFGAAHLDSLWKAMRMLENPYGTRQTTMKDFFK